MAKKEDTPLRNARRKYEEINKEERKQTTEQFNTRLPRKIYEEISQFLKENNIRKIDLIYAGYIALQEQHSKKEKVNLINSGQKTN